MPTILLQTTVARCEAHFSVDDFSELAAVLRDGGHTVTSRDREPGADGSDPVLSSLASSEYDELWLMAVDRGNALSPADVRGILRFRERGGGVLTARDREDFGTSLLNLGALGAVNHFKSYNRLRGGNRPKYVSDGADGRCHRVVPVEPIHDVLRSKVSPSGIVEFFPAHPQEGAISVPGSVPYARAIATSSDSGSNASLAIAIENETAMDGTRCGRALAVPSVHHFADEDWRGIDPVRLKIYQEYVRNVARWLAA